MKQSKALKTLLIVIAFATLLAGCGNLPTTSELTKYQDMDFDNFDTVISLIAFTKTEEEFQDMYKGFVADFTKYDNLFDIYNSYEGLNNIKTINDNAGIAPVKVDKDIIELLNLAKDLYTKSF